MKTLQVITSILFLSFALSSCSKEQASFNTSFNGLEDLGPDYRYEGWLIVNGNAKTAGIFSVDANGTPSSSSFEINEKDLNKADRYVLTIEPHPDSDPDPSAVHILAGDFSGNTANLSVDHGSALGTDFTSSSGSYILATPTDGNANNETSGVWFLDPNGPSASLNLPTLPGGWQYEGWAVINGQAISTGTFLDPTAADSGNPFSGTAASAPPFPGEDYLINAPSGFTFPTDLSDGTIVISVEPFPDNSEAPFTLKPLVGNVPASAMSGTSYSLTNNASASNPTGSVSK